MDKRVNFMAYCAEIYKENKNLSGRSLSELFERYGIWEYIYESFEYLHVTGSLYTIQCIDEFIDSQVV